MKNKSYKYFILQVMTVLMMTTASVTSFADNADIQQAEEKIDKDEVIPETKLEESEKNDELDIIEETVSGNNENGDAETIRINEDESLVDREEIESQENDRDESPEEIKQVKHETDSENINAVETVQETSTENIEKAVEQNDEIVESEDVNPEETEGSDDSLTLIDSKVENYGEPIEIKIYSGTPENTYHQKALFKRRSIAVSRSVPYLDMCYAYQQLDDTEKADYINFYQLVKNRTNDWVELQSADIQKVFYAVHNDHPELIGLSGLSIATDQSGRHYVAANYREYAETKDEVDELLSQCVKTVKTAESNMNLHKGDLEVVRQIFDYLTETISYDRADAEKTNGSKDQDMNSALINNLTVCAGYAKAFQYMCYEAGIPCTYIMGTAEGGGHAWDLIKINGEYYYADPTWGDLGEQNKLDQQVLTTDYYYLAATRKRMDDTGHDPSKTEDYFTLPECTSEKYDYFKYYGLDLESESENELTAVLRNGVLHQYRKSIFCLNMPANMPYYVFDNLRQCMPEGYTVDSFQVLNSGTEDPSARFFIKFQKKKTENNNDDNIPVTEIHLHPTQMGLNVGEEKVITAEVLPGYATNKDITWEINDPAVATVDQNGLVTGVRAGTTIVIAKVENGSMTATCSVTVKDVTESIETVTMYRLYNPNSGEHFYTGSEEERDNLISTGWKYEGIGWIAPMYTGDPVYRLYNPNAGDHHYTMSESERNNLETVGWKYEGICWNSADSDQAPLYRLYNSNTNSAGAHHYTLSNEEKNNLVSLGWKYEGVSWYGVK
jgi:hypothetical protein